MSAAAQIADALPAAAQEISTSTDRAQRFYHPELDGLRFLAFLGVFVLHCYPILPPKNQPDSPIAREVLAWFCSIPQAGVAGVDLFFVLSSFLITELLLREHERSGKIDVRAFYIRRTLRIWPLYFFFLTLATCIEPLFSLHQGESFGMPWPFTLAFYGFVGNWAIALTGKELNSTAIVLWTVSIEEQFYLAWPLLLKLARPKRLLWLSLGMIVVALTTRAFLCWENVDPHAIKWNTLARLDSLACGSLLALAMRKWSPDLSRGARNVLFWCGIILFLATYRYLALVPFQGADLLKYSLWAIASAMVLVSVLRSKQAVEREYPSILASPPLVYLGRISYGLYVWHLACIVGLCYSGLLRQGDWTLGLYALPVTIGVAAASYEWLERPFLRWKATFSHVPSREDGEAASAAKAIITG
ncbi:MAG: acyltransferase family protein [Pirellulaceae bacterium]